LPREVGKHPEDGEPIMAGIGQFGPYVKHVKNYANLEDGDDVFSVGLNRAVALIADRKANPKRRFGADPGRPLGEHPDQGGQIVVKKGRYGPYVTHDGVNANLPSDIAPESITLEQATILIDARAASGGGRKKAKAKPKTKAKAPKDEPKTDSNKTDSKRAAQLGQSATKAAVKSAPKKAVEKALKKPVQTAAKDATKIVSQNAAVSNGREMKAATKVPPALPPARTVATKSVTLSKPAARAPKKVPAAPKKSAKS
jgi:DNA topoisomerase-1